MRASFDVLRRVRRLARAGLVAAALLVPCRAHAQLRTHLTWQTVETPNFMLHFAEEYRDWSLGLAARLEGIRAQVSALVGFAPHEKVNIIIDDPFNSANGEAFTPLDVPAIVLYPTPPSPREAIGNYRVWSEMVATHEFAHVAHLSRPSRNRWQNLLWDLSPVPMGPVAINSPRWVIEGYATFVEGRVTGSGRPNHAWRAAILRQFALEGRLPSYQGLSDGGGWEGGNFAYLAGSAYLEWLAKREGDSSVTALWKRMTAKTVRDFDEAFVGVYGNSAASLYGRFVAEITADALSFDRALNREAAVPGALVQRLARNTGDPAISPDGRFVALVLRHADGPSEVVVWKTEDEPDTALTSRRAAQLRKDPDDVPDRPFYPAPKRPVITLAATDGASYEDPRWFADNKRILLSRLMPLRNGGYSPDLFSWSAEDGTITRLTRAASIREADPYADGKRAAAIRCIHGWCDLVEIDLLSGDVRTLAPGSPTRTYYRPRVSRRTGEIVVAQQLGDRWRIVRVDPRTGIQKFADPDDGVTRYDATYEPDGVSVVATSEANGIANLERLGTNAQAVRLTAVTGAAVAGEAAPEGALWFLSLTANGYDLRRIMPDAASLARARGPSVPMHLSLVDSLSPVLPPRTLRPARDSTMRPSVGEFVGPTLYDYGPTRVRYVPAILSELETASFQLSLIRSDPVGRFGAAGTVVLGVGLLPAGLSVELRDRRTTTTRIANAWSSHEAPSRALLSAYGEALDLTRVGAGARVQSSAASDGGEVVAMFGVLGEYQKASGFAENVRGAAVGQLTFTRRQRDQESRYVEQLTTFGEIGGTAGGAYGRQRSTLLFGTSANGKPLNLLRISYGTLAGGVASTRERFEIGGLPSPLVDGVYDARRVDAPAYPLGSAASLSYLSYRVALPFPPAEVYYSGVSPDIFKSALRSFGIEIRQHVAAVAPLGTPELDLLTGIARAVDAPVRGAWKYYISLAVHP